MKFLAQKWGKPTARTTVAAALAFGVALLTGGFVDGDEPQAANDGARSLIAESIDKSPSKCFALLVGVNQYENGLAPLNYATSDALALKETLVKIGFPEESVQVFFTSANVSEHPTKKRIMRAFERIIAEADEESAIFVSFSGHGFETKDGAVAFCPTDVVVDFSEKPPIVEKETAIVINDVAEALRGSKARFKMLVVDACRAAAGAKNVDEGNGWLVRPDATGLAFLQSCDSGQISWEHSSLGRGVFTHFLIEALEGKAATNDGGVSFLGAGSYVARKTREFARKNCNATQTPFQEFKGVDFWIVEPKVGDAELACREGREAWTGENGKNIDGAKAFALLTKAEAAGSLAARAFLAHIRLDGAPDVEVDAEEAFRLAQEPARQGDAHAYVALALCYLQGLGVGRNEKKGSEYFRKAFEGFQKLAETGDIEATRFLGCLYGNGYGVKADREKAAELIKLAADGGSVRAKGDLGLCYVYGYGCEKNVAEGLDLLEKACASGFAQAAQTLGAIYSSQYPNAGVEKDDAKAFEYFRKGSEGAWAAATTDLANAYRYGCGVEKDEAKALELYEEAARANEANAIATLGEAYFNGLLGKEKDPKKAVEYWKRAADMEHIAALERLQYCYENGIGVKKSPSMASRLRARLVEIKSRYAE